MSTVLIAGASVGGIRTAQALRSEGFEDDIVVIDEQRQAPYDKPPLSKGVLTGKESAASVGLLTDEAVADLRLQLVLGQRARQVDLDHRVVRTQEGEEIAFDQLVIATGAAARRSPWGERRGIHVVRTLPDAEALRADLLAGGPVVVVGGGFIGAEVAASACSLGLEVTIVDPVPTLMGRSMSPEEGAVFADFHRRRGVTCRLGAGVEAIDGEAPDFDVRLSDGTSLTAATVVIGIGATPNVDWLRDSGLDLADGLVCDAHCRAVGTTGVYGVGDVARWHDPARNELVRLEHWTNAVDQAACVAYNITHPDAPRTYSPIEYVWSDQHDWKIQLVGRPHAGGESTTIGDPADERFAVLHRGADGRFVGAVIVNWPRALVACRKAIGAAAPHHEVVTTLEALRPAGVSR